MEAKDHMGERWWEAKVLEVDTEGSEVLVHFTGEWIKREEGHCIEGILVF